MLHPTTVSVVTKAATQIANRPLTSTEVSEANFAIWSQRTGGEWVEGILPGPYSLYENTFFLLDEEGEVVSNPEFAVAVLEVGSRSGSLSEGCEEWAHLIFRELPAGVPAGWELFTVEELGSGNLFERDTRHLTQIHWEGEEGRVVKPEDPDWVQPCRIEVERWEAGSAGQVTYEIYLPAHITLLVEHYDSTRTGAEHWTEVVSGSSVPEWFREAQDQVIEKVTRTASGGRVTKAFLGLYNLEARKKETHQVTQDGRLVFWGIHKFSRFGRQGTALFAVLVYNPTGRQDGGGHWEWRKMPVSHLRRELQARGLKFNNR